MIIEGQAEPLGEVHASTIHPMSAIQVVDIPEGVLLTVGGPTDVSQADCQEYASAMSALACLADKREGKAADMLRAAAAEIERLKLCLEQALDDAIRHAESKNRMIGELAYALGLGRGLVWTELLDLVERVPWVAATNPIVATWIGKRVEISTEAGASASGELLGVDATDLHMDLRPKYPEPQEVIRSNWRVRLAADVCLCGVCSHARSRGEAPPHTTPTLRSSEG
jgi:hypothetical protein